MKKIFIVGLCALLSGSAVSVYVATGTPDATSNLMTANIEAMADAEADQCTYQSSVYDYVCDSGGKLHVQCLCAGTDNVCYCL